MSNVALVVYQKRILDLTVGAPGSTQDKLCFKEYGVLQKKNIAGKGLLDKIVKLGEEFGDIPLVKIGDSAFLYLLCLIKSFNSNTEDMKKRLYNLKP